MAGISDLARRIELLPEAMNALPPESAFHGGTPGRDDTLGLQWAALREAAGVIATLARVEAQAARELAFPASLRDAPPRRCVMIEQAIGDLVAVMEPGVAALIAVCERGGDPAPAARALWQEFVRARIGLAALAPPPANERA